MDPAPVYYVAVGGAATVLGVVLDLLASGVQWWWLSLAGLAGAWGGYVADRA